MLLYFPIFYTVSYLGKYGVYSFTKTACTSEEDCSHNLWHSPQNAHRTALWRYYSTAHFAYKLTTCLLPTMFEKMFRSTSQVHANYTRQTDLLYVQYASTRRTQRTIEYFGTKLRKSLCIVIDVAIITFKQRPKDFLWSWSLSILDLIVILIFVSFILSSLICLIIIIIHYVFISIFVVF